MNEETIRRLIRRAAPSAPLIGRKNYMDAAVIVPLIYISGEYHLLFQQRSENIPQGNEICFPGGEFDPSLDKTLEQTALRETVEELGIGMDRIGLTGRLGTLVTVRGMAIDCFVAMLNTKTVDELAINRAEVARVFTLPLSWFMEHEPVRYFLRVQIHSRIVDCDGTPVTLFPARELDLPSRYWESWYGKDRPAVVYKTPEGPVWGVTAEIVEELVNRLVEV